MSIRPQEAIVLTGEMACVPGIVDEVEARLSEQLQRDVEIVRAERPDLVAAAGAHEITDHLAGSL